jgi:2-keto-4-pentenoate hydratase/2-oxohepta-3-ene-1,7-dioic acid hydratase in catechol pathway
MRIVRFQTTDGTPRWGRDLGDGTALPLQGDLFGALREAGAPLPITRRRCPLAPRAILCIGLNYRDHARETGKALPDRPVLFMKNPAAAWHPDTAIALPQRFVERPEVDYEVELAVIIGKAARNVSPSDALEHVFGYTIGNDVSARRVQKRGGGGQWVRGKSFDTFCPLGPVVVTADEIPDPQQLGLRTRLNGELMQDSNTSEMIFGVAELIADLSTDTTLLPGTVLMTGTPAGVGFVRDPRRFLMPGDTLELEIDGIGVLRNPVGQAD